MNKKKVIILGSSGGLGAEVKKSLSTIKYRIYSFSSKDLNFLMKDSQHKITQLREFVHKMGKRLDVEFHATLH